MIDNEYLINKITLLLKKRQNNLFSGTINNPTLFSECNVIRDNDNLIVKAINLNCISPGKVIVVKDVDDNKYYCFTNIENNINSTKNILYRKTIPNKDNLVNYYKELYDLNNIFLNKEIKVSKKVLKIQDSAKKIYKLFSLKNNNKIKLLENTDLLLSNYNYVEQKDYLVTYSDNCKSLTDTNFKQYKKYIDKTNDNYRYYSDTTQQPISTIKDTDKFFVTNFTPKILFSFICNGNDSRRDTDLSNFFNNPINELTRDKNKYNPNFYYIWRLMEKTDEVCHAYGWVTISGYLKITKRSNSTFVAFLTPANHFVTNYGYDGYMRIEIGGLDRTSLFSSTDSGKGRILFSKNKTEKSRTDIPPIFSDTEDPIKLINNDISKITD